MVRPHVLYYAQDPGGTRYLDPVIMELVGDDVFSWSILLHPFAKNSGLMDDKYANQRISFSDQVSVSATYFEGLLTDQNPDAVVCTTSAQARDASNGALIAMAKQHGIPCIAALDHWKGLDRFFEGTEPCFFPDQLICIDDTTKNALGEAGLDTSKVHAVGHPGLEHIGYQAITINAPPWRVLLVSQPIVKDGTYHGIFDQRIGEHGLMDQIADALDDKDFELFLRRHPKEYAGSALPMGISMNDDPDWNAARGAYDVFIGFDSMALIEASLSGAPCVRLALPELAEISDQSVPLDYGVPTTTLKDLAANIRLAVGKMTTETVNPFAGSTSRAVDIIRNFVNSNK